MKIGFIGAGKMAQALCKGFISAAMVKPANILASDVNTGKLESFREQVPGAALADSNMQLVTDADIVYISVKPYVVAEVLHEVSPRVTSDNLFVSIAAGINTRTLEKHLPAGCRVVRVMPNTPAVVQSAASVYSPGRWASVADCTTVADMFRCVGLVEEMNEDLMDAVTGLSGSGPAYGFVAIQAMADGGVKMGLARDQSLRLAAQTMLGAAKMILETKGHPEALKDEVSSPAGTTAHALHRLERSGFRASLVDAVEAATLRSREIGRMYNDLQKIQDEDERDRVQYPFNRHDFW